MEKSEPSFVPEWLRSKESGGSSHLFVSSQAVRRSSSNSQRSSNSNGSSNRHDRDPYSRSYNSSSRNQSSKSREKLGVDDTWGSEYSDPLTSFNSRRLEKGSLGRSKSTIPSRDVEFLQRRAVVDLRSKRHNINSNGNELVSSRSSSTDAHVSFQREFPLFESDERTTMPDIVRVPSPGLSQSVEGLSIGSSPLLGSDGRTSAFAKVPVNGPSALNSASTSGAVGSNDLNKTEASIQAPLSSLGAPQAHRFEELHFVGNKKLIPMIPSASQKMVLNPSDKLKPRTAARSNDGVTGPKNGLQQISPALHGSQTVRGGNILADIPKSSGMLLLKPTRGKSGSPALKDTPGAVANGPSTNVPSLISVPYKNANNPNHSNTNRKTSAFNMNVVAVVDRRSSVAQLRSRNDFLNRIRKKSSGISSGDGNCGTGVSSSMQNLDDRKETTCISVGPSENGDGKCNVEACSIGKSCSDKGVSGVSHNEVIHTAEELDFLHALGWEDDGGDDEGLTEEEINTFVKKYMTSKPAEKLLKGLQLKMMPKSDSQGPCSASAASELSISNTQI